MRITTLTLNSYKSFVRSTQIALSTNFNVFIGANNCGKTNILDAIDFLFHPTEDPARLHHHRSSVTAQVDLTDEQAKKFGVAKPLSMRARGYDVIVHDADGKKIPRRVVSEIGMRVKRLQYESFLDVAEIEREYSLLAQKYPDVFTKLTGLLRNYFPEVGSLDRIADADTPGGARVSEGSHTSITIERLGSGFRRALVIVLYALHPEYSVILIDEPEIHLHPALIKKIRKVLQDAKANQVIVTSHSPIFVAASTLHQVYRVLKDAQGSQVHYLAQNSRAIDRRRLVQELNADNIEMFFADTVLLVEGVSDRILMRGLIDRFYRGPKEIKVIYTHGKSNIDIFMDLMRVFRIPYVVLLDRDALRMTARELGVHGTRGRRKQSSVELFEALRKRNIIVLPNGTIEQNYPRKYQRRDTKPLNALHAAANITEREYRSPIMKHIRSIIESF